MRPARARGSRLTRLTWVLALCSAGFWPGVPVAAQDLRAVDCCPLLLVPVGARSSAMGGAVTAGGGPDAMFRNPAGLAAVRGGAFLLHHSDRTLVDINAFSLVTTPRIGAFGLTYQLFDKGTSTHTDGTGQPIGELSLRDHLVVGSFGAGLGSSMAVGVNYKMFQVRIDCRGACEGADQVTTYHGADLGYRYLPRWQTGLQFGIAAVNIPLQSSDETSALPGRLYVGVAYNILHPFRIDEGIALRLALDFQDELRNLGSMVPSAGLELDMQEVLYLRAGYTLGEGIASGAAIGVELRYDRFDVGLSRSFVNSGFEEGEPFQITFGVRFRGAS